MSHPYKALADYQRWRHNVAGVSAAQFDPLNSFPLKILKKTKVATAGSCFAQHIAQRLSSSGYNYLVTESGHEIAEEKTRKNHQYGLFTARFGNIYTVRQLLQLIQEAYGERQPLIQSWALNDKFVDPLRPKVEPNGFYSENELKLDRQQHLRAVRQMFETLDVFVFTMGLTEAWIDKRDGTVYPICPGVYGGEFDPEIHQFHNFTSNEIIEDLMQLVVLLGKINSTAKIILTVSPVPLVATAEDRSVLLSTVYSKSALRVAAEEVVRQYPDSVFYFPSYEIITGHHAQGGYFDDDLRSVTTEGVDHVMRIFFKHLSIGFDQNETVPEPQNKKALVQQVQKATQLVCEEELLDAAPTKKS